VAKFKLDEIERVGKQVSKKARYPIGSRDDLIEALGGRGAKFKYEGKDRNADEVAQVPDDTFPIKSEVDFVEKMATLRARGGDEAEGFQKGKEK
jgi:hypothetical protein